MGQGEGDQTRRREAASSVMETKEQVRTWKKEVGHETHLLNNPRHMPNIYIMQKYTLYDTIDLIIKKNNICKIGRKYIKIVIVVLSMVGI